MLQLVLGGHWFLPPGDAHVSPTLISFVLRSRTRRAEMVSELLRSWKRDRPIHVEEEHDGPPRDKRENRPRPVALFILLP
jgi:hypothetical protein